MKSTIKTKLYIYFGLSMIITSIITCGLFFSRYRHELDNGINDKLLIAASITVNAIDISHMSMAHNPGFYASEKNMQFLKSLKNISKSFGFKYIYIMTKENKEYPFIYDSGNYEPEDGYENSFLKPYTDYPPELDKAWNTRRIPVCRIHGSMGICPVCFQSR